MNIRPGSWTAAWGIVVAVHLFLMSCDGDGRSNRFTGPLPIVNESAAGIYRGTFTTTLDPNPVAEDIVVIISEDNDAQFIVTSLTPHHYAGDIYVAGSSLSATLTDYRGSVARFFGISGLDTVHIDGNVLEAGAIAGDYSGTSDNGRFVLQYQDSYETASSLDFTSGVWVSNMVSPGGGIYSIAWDIDINGVIFGTDTHGCVFSGQMRIIDSRYNAYRVYVDISSCNRMSGEYNGLAFLSAVGAQQPNWMTLGISNNVFAFSTVLQR
jgi:hypothetical protein